MTIKDVLETFKLEFEYTDKDTFGVLYREYRKISFNVYLYLTETFIHEYFHIQYPEDTESNINWRTQMLISKMSDKQIMQMAGLIFKRIGEDKK